MRIGLWAVSGAGMLLAGPALAQAGPDDMEAVPPVATHFVPGRTAWGDPDFRATWTGDQFSYANIELERPAEQGRRLWLTDEEFAKRLADAEKSDANRVEINAHLMPSGGRSLASWLRSTQFGRRTSLIVSPADGRLPPLTPAAQARFKAGRTSWNEDQPIDWVSDLDALDRCIARGFPAAMLPSDRDSGNGIRIFQAQGLIAFQIEMMGTRVVPIGQGPGWPGQVRGWLGGSRGHWEGRTMVIETANFVAGDSASPDTSQRAASPSSSNMQIPVGQAASAVERLTMTAPGKLLYEVTYSDPEVFTAPWTVQVEWSRDDRYRIYEFACHEGNVQVRDMINSSRAARAEARTSVKQGRK